MASKEHQTLQVFHGFLPKVLSDGINFKHSLPTGVVVAVTDKMDTDPVGDGASSLFPFVSINTQRYRWIRVEEVTLNLQLSQA